MHEKKVADSQSYIEMVNAYTDRRYLLSWLVWVRNELRLGENCQSVRLNIIDTLKNDQVFNEHITDIFLDQDPDTFYEKSATDPAQTQLIKDFLNSLHNAEQGLSRLDEINISDETSRVGILLSAIPTLHRSIHQIVDSVRKINELTSPILSNTIMEQFQPLLSQASSIGEHLKENRATMGSSIQAFTRLTPSEAIGTTRNTQASELISVIPRLLGQITYALGPKPTPLNETDLANLKKEITASSNLLKSKFDFLDVVGGFRTNISGLLQLGQSAVEILNAAQNTSAAADAPIKKLTESMQNELLPRLLEQCNGLEANLCLKSGLITDQVYDKATLINQNIQNLQEILQQPGAIADGITSSSVGNFATGYIIGKAVDLPRQQPQTISPDIQKNPVFLERLSSNLMDDLAKDYEELAEKEVQLQNAIKFFNTIEQAVGSQESGLVDTVKGAIKSTKYGGSVAALEPEKKIELYQTCQAIQPLFSTQEKYDFPRLQADVLPTPQDIHSYLTATLNLSDEEIENIRQFLDNPEGEINLTYHQEKVLLIKHLLKDISEQYPDEIKTLQKMLVPKVESDSYLSMAGSLLSGAVGGAMQVVTRTANFITTTDDFLGTIPGQKKTILFELETDLSTIKSRIGSKWSGIEHMERRIKLPIHSYPVSDSSIAGSLQKRDILEHQLSTMLPAPAVAVAQLTDTSQVQTTSIADLRSSLATQIQGIDDDINDQYAQELQKAASLPPPKGKAETLFEKLSKMKLSESIRSFKTGAFANFINDQLSEDISSQINVNEVIDITDLYPSPEPVKTYKKIIFALDQITAGLETVETYHDQDGESIVDKSKLTIDVILSLFRDIVQGINTLNSVSQEELIRQSLAPLMATLDQSVILNLIKSNEQQTIATPEATRDIISIWKDELELVENVTSGVAQPEVAEPQDEPATTDLTTETVIAAQENPNKSLDDIVNSLCDIPKSISPDREIDRNSRQEIITGLKTISQIIQSTAYTKAVRDTQTSYKLKNALGAISESIGIAGEASLDALSHDLRSLTEGMVRSADMAELQLGFKSGDNILDQTFSAIQEVLYQVIEAREDIDESVKLIAIESVNLSQMRIEVLQAIKEEKAAIDYTEQRTLITDCYDKIRGIREFTTDAQKEDFLKTYALLQPLLEEIDVNFDLKYYTRELQTADDFVAKRDLLEPYQEKLTSLIYAKESTVHQLQSKLDTKIADITKHQGPNEEHLLKRKQAYFTTELTRTIEGFKPPKLPSPFHQLYADEKDKMLAIQITLAPSKDMKGILEQHKRACETNVSKMQEQAESLQALLNDIDETKSLNTKNHFTDTLKEKLGNINTLLETDADLDNLETKIEKATEQHKALKNSDEMMKYEVFAEILEIEDEIKREPKSTQKSKALDAIAEWKEILVKPNSDTIKMLTTLTNKMREDIKSFTPNQSWFQRMLRVMMSLVRKLLHLKQEAKPTKTISEIVEPRRKSIIKNINQSPTSGPRRG